jgi:hypothetical protein
MKYEMSLLPIKACVVGRQFQEKKLCKTQGARGKKKAALNQKK